MVLNMKIRVKLVTAANEYLSVPATRSTEITKLALVFDKPGADIWQASSMVGGLLP